MSRILQAALEYREAGISCVPCLPGTKEAHIKWKDLQDTLLPLEKLLELFQAHTGNIAFVAGRASGNLVCIDCEDQGFYRECKAEFETRIGETWTVKSHRGGHIYLRSKEPINGHSIKGKPGEIRAQGQILLAPPSIHPQGTPYVFETRPAVIPIVDSLPLIEMGLVKPQGSVIVQPQERRVKPDFTLHQCHQVFQDRNYQRRNYRSRSEFDYAVIVTLVNKGAPFELIQESFKEFHFNTRYQRLLRETGSKAADQYLQTSYNKACSQPDKPEYIELCEDVEQQAQQLRSIVLGHPEWWRGRGKQTDRDVMLAHIEQYEHCKATPWNLDCRRGAELAECTHQTFSRSTNRLIQDNFLFRAKATHRYTGTAAAYDFGDKIKSVLNEPYIQSDNNVCIWLGEIASHTETYGVFERSLLFGKIAKHIYFALLVYGPSTVKEISDRTGASITTIRNNCKVLEEYSLICGINKKYQATPDYDFKQLSEDLGAKEIQEIRRRCHQADREQQEDFREWAKIQKQGKLPDSHG